MGRSAAPLVFLAVSTAVNIGLDLWFVLGLGWGWRGRGGHGDRPGVSAGGIALYCALRLPLVRLERRHCAVRRRELGRIVSYSLLTCVQQSVMNFGILMVQGLVNSFGVNVMAAFAAAVKIDAFAYLPVQDFGNAFSTFVAQNTGAEQPQRIRRGIRSAAITALAFSLAASVLVCLFAGPLMTIFVSPAETEIIAVGVQYLRIEGPATAASASSSCSTACFGAWGGPGCRWPSPSSPWAHGWPWPTSSPLSPPWAFWASGGRCLSAGAWRTWRASSSGGVPARPNRKKAPGPGPSGPGPGDETVEKGKCFFGKGDSLRSAPRSSACGGRFDARSAQSVFSDAAA